MLFGITEKPNGTPRSEQFNSDYDEVSHVLHRLDEDSDHVCLTANGLVGSVPCPTDHVPYWSLLVLPLMSHTFYQREDLCPPLFIRCDLSPTQCLEWFILLREKRKLIESGTVDATTVKYYCYHC